RMPVTPRTVSSPPGERLVGVDESQQETRGVRGGTSKPSPLDNWPDTGPVARALTGGADVGR
ncbi:MAG: hypothetical protein ACRDS9_14910, partial [Pseudonocardiaceae bacterium]